MGKGCKFTRFNFMSDPSGSKASPTVPMMLRLRSSPCSSLRSLKASSARDSMRLSWRSRVSRRERPDREKRPRRWRELRRKRSLEEESIDLFPFLFFEKYVS